MTAMDHSAPSCTHPKRVLVVDDNDLILRLVARQLRREGFDVAMAAGGHAAVEWCEENGKPDLLLTDVRMPGIDGPTLYKQLNERFPNVSVLFMSATAQDMQDLVITPLLRKPFDIQQLNSMVHASLQTEPSELTAR